MGAAIQRLGNVRVYEALSLLSLIALCFPALAMIHLGGSVLFPHYMVLALAMPVLFARRPMLLRPVLPILGMIAVSSLINASTVSFYVALFHSLHLMAAALLASCPGWLALRFAKATILIYAVAILLTQLMVAVGLEGLVGWLMVQKEGLSFTRVSAFATEPSYSAMIILILSRFVIVCDSDWVTGKRLGVIVGALVASLSLYALISATLILAMLMVERGGKRVIIGILVGSVVMLVGMSQTDFFASRLASIELSHGVRGLNTGTPRLLPYVYIAETLPENPWPLLVGAGAGALEPAFFTALGQYSTEHDHLATHMAGPLYDYGLVAILPILLLWNRPKTLKARALFVGMTLIVLMNTSIGTYLFILFGTFALLEQRLRTA